jgi:hypothetical protein
MEFAGHKKIKDFSIDGQIYDDADFPRLRAQYEVIVEEVVKEAVKRRFVPAVPVIT